MREKCNAVLETGFTVVFYKPGKHVGGMSLNRSEQILYDYMQGKHEERQYWQTKVQTIVGASLEIPDAVAQAFAAALERWPRDGVPASPDAWLLTAARRRLLMAATVSSWSHSTPSR